MGYLLTIQTHWSFLFLFFQNAPLAFTAPIVTRFAVRPVNSTIPVTELLESVSMDVTADILGITATTVILNTQLHLLGHLRKPTIDYFTKRNQLRAFLNPIGLTGLLSPLPYVQPPPKIKEHTKTKQQLSDVKFYTKWGCFTLIVFFMLDKRILVEWYKLLEYLLLSFYG